MKSRLVLLATTGALALAPTAAHADFPEQPGANAQRACQALINSGTLTAFGFPGLDDGAARGQAESRTDAQYFDACLGG